MIRDFASFPGIRFRWIDVVYPSEEELGRVAAEHNLHATSVQDCLQPEHLPKYEEIGDSLFIVTRLFDREASPDAATVRGLTRKIAVFFRRDCLITIHRVEHECLAGIRDRWTGKKPNRQMPLRLLLDVIRETLLSYEMPINEAENQFEEYEDRIIDAGSDRDIIKELYNLRRRVFVYHRLISLTLELLSKLRNVPPQSTPYLQDARETAQKLAFYSAQLLENVNNLLNLHLALSSHRTNEVMRVLTVFSVFFMPLTFIAGIYGMNFLNMPELKHPQGYYYTLIGMGLLVLVIFLWFRKKRWLG